MNTASKLAAFAAAVTVAFGGAMAVGAAVGPIDVGDDSAHETVGDTGPALPRGLAVAEGGHRLVPATTTIAADTPTPFSFRILDDAGTPVTGFEVLHERPLHLIVLSRNLVDYAHLHPTLDHHTGDWTVELPSLPAGSYRVFADFEPSDGDNVTLATDLLVPGSLVASDIPAPTLVDVIDGYTVTLSGTPQAGDSELRFHVELADESVTPEPYLGAAGHLVAIRTGDLAYLHVHPHEDVSDGVAFTAEFPTPGTYRLFLDFSHNGTVRTAAFTIDVPNNADNTGSLPNPSHDEGH